MLHIQNELTTITADENSKIINNVPFLLCNCIVIVVDLHLIDKSLYFLISHRYSYIFHIFFGSQRLSTLTEPEISV